MNYIEHLLACLSEEAAEVSQDANKALRFGINDVYPKKPELGTMAERITREINELLAVYEMLVDAGFPFPREACFEIREAKKVKILKNMVYARNQGALTCSHESLKRFLCKMNPSLAKCSSRALLKEPKRKSKKSAGRSKNSSSRRTGPTATRR